MADETERVEYVFEGDVSSLRSATQAALSLLSKYSDSMRRASTLDAFTASRSSAKAMGRSITQLTSDVTKMQAKLKSVGDVKLPTGSAAAKTFSSTLSTLTSQMQQLGSMDNVTNKTLRNFNTQLRNVSDSVKSVEPQVDKLVSSKQRLQNVLGTVSTKATQFKNTMSSMQTRLAAAFEPVQTGIRSLTSLFDRITSKVQSFKDKAANAFSRLGQQTTTVSAAFRRVALSTESADDAAARSTRSHSNLGSVLAQLVSRFKRETSAVTSERSALNSKNTILQRSTTLHDALSQTISKLGSSLKSEVSKLGSFGGSLKSVGSIAGFVTKGLSAILGVQLGNWLGDAANKAIDMVENINLFDVAMGSSAEQGRKFVDQMQEVYGMDPSNLYRYAGGFYQLTDAIGMSDKASAVLSLSLTKAANDIASLYNVKIETVVSNLKSGMQGMATAVKKYGMDIRVTTLQQTALNYGLTGEVKYMSEANRQALRYLTMMEQVSNATKQMGTDVNGASAIVGDFANNIETPANQIRILQEQMSQLGRAIGNFIVAPLSRAIAYINGFVMALRMAINFIGSLLGVLNVSSGSTDTGGLEDTKDALDDVESSAAGASNSVNGLLSSFDELNVLQESSGGGGAGSGLDDVLDPKLAKAIEDMQLELENIRMKANDVRDALLKMFGFEVKDGTITKWDSGKFWDSLEGLDANAEKLAADIAQKLNDAISKFPAATLGKAIGTFINAGLTAAVTFTYTFDFKQLGSKIADTILNGIASVDFYNLGKWSVASVHIITDLITGILDSLEQSIDGYTSGWDMLGDKIADWIEGAFDSIPWGQLGVNVTRIASGIYKLLIRILEKVQWDDIGEDIASFINGIDFSTIFNNLLKLGVEVIKALGSAFGSLWENADPETKALLIGAGLLLLRKPLKTVIDLVTGLTTGFQQKNSALQEQTGLETSAATALSTNLIPQLGIAAGTVGLLGTAIYNLNEGLAPSIELEGDLSTATSNLATNTSALRTATDNLNTSVQTETTTVANSIGTITNAATNMQQAVTNTDAYGESFRNLGRAAVISSAWTATGFDTINAAAEQLDPTPIQRYATSAVMQFGAITSSIKSAIGAIQNYKTELSVLTGETVTSPVPASRPLFPEKDTSQNADVGGLDFDKVAQDINKDLGFAQGILGALGLGALGSLGAIPAFASGGVVTSPTLSLVGEAGYSEAIIPLEDSPQMNELVQRIAEAVDKTSTTTTPVDVTVIIGDKEWDAFTYKSAKRGEKLVGAQPVEVLD